MGHETRASLEMIGQVGYEFASFTEYRAQIPSRQRRRACRGKSRRQSGVVSDDYHQAVYQTLVNVDNGRSGLGTA